MPSENDRPPLVPPSLGKDSGAMNGDSSGSWKEAFGDLLSSKVGIFTVEAKDAAALAVGKIVFLGSAAFFLMMAWILVNAALVGVISDSTSWRWYHGLFALAAGHCIIAIILLLVSRKKTADPFPVTRAELEKDREWLDRLKKH